MIFRISIILLSLSVFVSGQNQCSQVITDFPYSEGYENTLGLWTQAQSNDINWLIDSDGTPSNNTGPSNAIEGNYYIYVESSGSNKGYPNKQAIINSPCFNISTENNAKITFNYHIFGSGDVGTISLEASLDYGVTWDVIWNESGSKGDLWQTVSVDVSHYPEGIIQFRFNRVTGNTWQGDLAIDNFILDTNLTENPQDVEGLFSIETLDTGNLINLSNLGGNFCNIDNHNTNVLYHISNDYNIVGGKAIIEIKTTSKPVIIGAENVKGSEWISNTKMHMIVQNIGRKIIYYFLEL